jgi:hypothetical protein
VGWVSANGLSSARTDHAPGTAGSQNWVVSLIWSGCRSKRHPGGAPTTRRRRPRPVRDLWHLAEVPHPCRVLWRVAGLNVRRNIDAGSSRVWRVRVVTASSGRSAHVDRCVAAARDRFGRRDRLGSRRAALFAEAQPVAVPRRRCRHNPDTGEVRPTPLGAPPEPAPRSARS